MNQSPLDYLNEISPQQETAKPFRLTIKTVLLIGLVLIVIVIIIAVIAGSVGNSKKEPWQQLPARLAVTTTVANDSTTRIKNSQLRSLNSDLKIYLTNTNRDLAAPLGRIGIDSAKLPESVVAAENGTGITQRLEDARLNAKFDSTYAREMSYQLSTLLALYQELFKSSSNTETKAFLTKAYADLAPTQQALITFSASNE